MNWDTDHIVHVAGETASPPAPETEIAKWRKHIEPWLSAVFQAEHLSLLLGNGFTTAMANLAGTPPVPMNVAAFGCPNEDRVLTHATAAAASMGRGAANIEDQISAALALVTGLKILGHADAPQWETAINRVFSAFIGGVLGVESGILNGLARAIAADGPRAQEALVSFLMSFASRAASRERLHIFTTNYDRLVEKGCDLAGLRIVDRFVGVLEPEFRSSRLQVDLHYMAPGVRGEPRHLEGVVHLTKLHGSVDWRYERSRLWRVPLGFGAAATHPAVPNNPRESVIIYPNAIKDVETAAHPYADLFRDFSAALCRPNSVLVTYGYGFGDDHINRVLADMLTIPSTHLVVIAWSARPHERISTFLKRVGHPQQVSLLVGPHFGDFGNLITNYLPKPAIDPLTSRMTELLERRGWRGPAGDAPDAEA